MQGEDHISLSDGTYDSISRPLNLCNIAQRAKLPYGLADHATGFATVPVHELLAAMQ